MSDSLEARKMQLIHDLRTVIRDTQALLHASQDEGKSGLQDLKKSMSEELERTVERLRRMEAYASEAISHSAQEVKGYVQRHPVQAVGISAGIGLLIGILVRRR
ncbi:MAG: hypothetical protein RL522_2425 [Pseudomonadota bacterium]|jgi:ElaB/YqjD/DUF883 family membrane-anchored ribosome-binding protein